MGEKWEWEVRGWGGSGVSRWEGRNRERKREKESTCGSHYSVGQDTVVLHGAFCWWRAGSWRAGKLWSWLRRRKRWYNRTGGPDNTPLKQWCWCGWHTGSGRSCDRSFIFFIPAFIFLNCLFFSFIPPPQYFFNIFPSHSRGAHFLPDFSSSFFFFLNEGEREGAREIKWQPGVKTQHLVVLSSTQGSREGGRS